MITGFLTLPLGRPGGRLAGVAGDMLTLALPSESLAGCWFAGAEVDGFSIGVLSGEERV